MILPATAVREEVRDDQQFLFPNRIGSSQMPIYPPELLKRGAADVVVCVEIVVGTEGAVESVQRLAGLPGCVALKGRDEQAFLDAVSDSVMRWQFLAAALCTFPAEAVRTDDCSGDGVSIQARRVKLAYRFSFSAQRGRAESRSIPTDY